MNEHPYDRLGPDMVLAAVESMGYLCDARLLALNSYENRVYQVGIEDDLPLIAKFYRPQRWSDAQIDEEHSFSLELAAADISVVAPLAHPDSGQTLHCYEDFRFALFTRRGGHPPELDNLDNLLVLGRTLGRIHGVGGTKKFQHRETLDPLTRAREAAEFLIENFIPADLLPAYTTLTQDLLQRIETACSGYAATEMIRVHGDCHIGNILWRDETAHFVDLDDSCMAPAVQDLWMFLNGDRLQKRLQISELVEGYNEFADFDPRQLHWIEALRTSRIMYYAAWLGRRWSDPAFPHSFPWFNSARYWSDHILELREQMFALEEPVLELF